ncbi:hypothetical protein LNK20_20690, partial [Bacillus safensis]|nr:hypothetical protein [Bacillus safensis]
ATCNAQPMRDATQFIKLNADDAPVELADNLLSVTVKEAADQNRRRPFTCISVDFLIAGHIGNAHRAFGSKTADAENNHVGLADQFELA